MTFFAKRKVFYSWGDLVGMTFCLSPREKCFLIRNNIDDVLDKPQWNLVDNIVCLSLSRFEWADLFQVDIANYRTYPRSRGDNTSTHFNKHFFVKYQLYHTNFVKHPFFFIFILFFLSLGAVLPAATLSFGICFPSWKVVSEFQSRNSLGYSKILFHQISQDNSLCLHNDNE